MRGIIHSCRELCGIIFRGFAPSPDVLWVGFFCGCSFPARSVVITAGELGGANYIGAVPASAGNNSAQEGRQIKFRIFLKVCALVRRVRGGEAKCVHPWEIIVWRIVTVLDEENG